MNTEKILITTKDEFIQKLSEENFDYLDFGCSKGNSLTWSKRLFGGKKGLGIDIDPKKVAEAQAAGHNAVVFDINNIPEKKLVRFTVLSHFLEHVPSENHVKAFVRKACQVSTDFVFIKQPYFDADGYLFQNGLKLFFSDWTGHPNQMTTLSLFKLVRSLKNEGLLHRFSIHGKKPILSSDDSHVLPINTPIDQHHFDSSKHPPKTQGLKFEFPVFYETVVMISMSGVSHYKHFKKFPTDTTFFESWSVD
ncbi:MAG: class I SAM-dependent methyltransferase [Limnospira sp. PMC 1281.21]|uniref:class I SAM-dependent methyltransferase n=1 Tax=Limnospira sp. PMC 1281.21 TaxID=2981064 RepID=UPI0016589AB5|nr:class I SAM-dependent methyltransferase [Limnospira sp. PMC 1281.21]MDT9302517.1 class I SAM-dependent methyltransferase [Limnospira sp. PMC 1281.21]